MSTNDIMKGIAGSLEDRWRTDPGNNGHFHFYTPGTSLRTTVEKGHSHAIDKNGNILDAHDHEHGKGQPS